MRMIASSSRARGVLARYGHLLPLTTGTPLLTLGEGATPLVRAPALERHTGLDAVYLKCEGCNPTGSFKDRGMVLAVARAVEDGARAVVCASTGNTSAAAAAYSARAGLVAVVLVPHGYVALGKLAQALAYGAHVLSRSEEHTSELQSHSEFVCRLLLEKKKHGILLPDSCSGLISGDFSGSNVVTRTLQGTVESLD